MGQLAHLLAPASVAVVGASDDPASFGGRAWRYLTRHFPGRAIPVNARPGAVASTECAPSLREVSPAPDAVVLATPAETVLGLLEEAGDSGARAAVVFSRDLLGQEDGIRQAAERLGLSVLGPNCLGLINANDAVTLSSSVSLERGTRPGPLALVAQSGALMGMLHARSLDLGYGLGLCVSTGSQAVVRTEHVLAELAETDGIKAVGAYLEDVDVSLFRAAATALGEAGIRLVALKGGSTRTGSEVTAAHSRALAADGRAFARLAREVGAVLVDDPDELLTTLAVCGTGGRRWRVATSSGGLAAIAADLATGLGLELPAGPAGERADGGPEWAPANPLDLEAVERPVPEKIAMIEALAADPAADGILTVVSDAPGLGGFLSQLAPVCRNHPERIIAVCECSQQFSADWADWVRAGLVYLPGLGPALRAISRIHAGQTRSHGAGRRDVATVRHRAGALAGQRRQAALLPPHEVQALLARAGLPVLPVQEARSALAARDAADRFGYPVVLKRSRAAHRGLAGVRLNLGNADDVAVAYAQLAADGPVLVQPQSPPGLEFYLAVRFDPTFGYVLAVGAGGPDAEAMADVAVSPLPASPLPANAEQVHGLLQSTLVGGWLASPASSGLFDLGALAAIAASARNVLAAEDGRLEALDLNPVVVHSGGATVVDAKATLAGPDACAPDRRTDDQETAA